MRQTLKNTASNFILFLVFFLFSCKKDSPPKEEAVILQGSGGLVLIANEGNFNFGNSTISVHEPTSGNTISDIYKPNNNNLPLGDVCQSLTILQNELFAVLNNSQKVTVIDLNTYQKKTEITGFISPRFLLQVSNHKAYVSNLKLSHTSNQIQILNPYTKSITGSINCKGWTEKMVNSYGKVFVTSPTSKYVYVINTSSDQIVDSLNVGFGNSGIVKDKDEKIWVIFSGDSLNGQFPGIAKINPVTLQIENTFYFPNYKAATDLQISASGEELVFLKNEVYKMNIYNSSLPNSPFISSQNNNFYSIGIDHSRSEIYVSDALNYIQNGIVFVYDNNGNLKRQFQTGIIPGYFLFKP